ncbi:MAG: enoyl-CoA hydratase/isomerase family protein [Planctomycetaceae bacterium]|nr:enoyl-CoA hydratase/isomerase family protein [Planctomycetaceae bacterium]
MPTSIDLAVADRVARVTFRTDNGVHILSAETRERLGEVIGELERMRDLRVVVFQSEGRTFIAGADIHELRALTPETALQVARQGQGLMQRVAALDAVTIVAIHAACAGGGCELSLACDLRLAAASARIGLPETSLGLLPGWGGTVQTVRLFGSALARRLILTGELLTADEALRVGLVDSLTPDEGFRAAVDARVAQILTRGPSAHRMVKHLVRRFEGLDIDAELTAEAVAFADCYRAPEAAEGTTAFLEKRPPKF